MKIMLIKEQIMLKYVILYGFFWIAGCHSNSSAPEPVKQPVHFLNTGNSKQIEDFLHYMKSSTPARTVSQEGDYYNNLAAREYLEGNYQKALEYNNKALAFRSDDEFGTAKSQNNLAVVYQALGDYAKALELYKKAADMLQILQKTAWYTYTQQNYTRLQQYLAIDSASGRVTGPPKEDPPILFVEY